MTLMTKYNIIVEKDEENWYTSEVLGLPGCHTQAKDMDELIKRTKEAIIAYLETEEVPKIRNFVGVKEIEV